MNDKLNEIIYGIDKTECDCDGGWWETSKGAEFGAEVKLKLTELISNQAAKTEGLKLSIKHAEIAAANQLDNANAEIERLKALLLDSWSTIEEAGFEDHNFELRDAIKALTQQ